MSLIRVASKPEPACVYVVAWALRGPVKIGQATDPIARLGELQVGNPYRLRIFFAASIVHYDARDVEAAAHAHFASVRLLGEWFRLTTTEARNGIRALFEKYDIGWDRWSPTARDIDRRKAQLDPTTAHARRPKDPFKRLVTARILP